MHVSKHDVHVTTVDIHTYAYTCTHPHTTYTHEHIHRVLLDRRVSVAVLGIVDSMELKEKWVKKAQQDQEENL